MNIIRVCTHIRGFIRLHSEKNHKSYPTDTKVISGRSFSTLGRSSNFTKYSGTSTRTRRPLYRNWIIYSSSIVLAGAGLTLTDSFDPVRHAYLASARCSRIANAVIIDAVDYKNVLSGSYESEAAREEALSKCHSRSARRVFEALLANGGIFIKLGQHMSSLVVLPSEWTSAMRPLQDQCEPTAIEDIDGLMINDLGKPISELFDDFDPKPLGVASLAQVHLARLKDSDQLVAVKVQHPHLAEFADIDMVMVETSLAWVKYWFPDFEFTWLGEEMRENLPKEMDFVHEAKNAARATDDFKNTQTSLYIPKVFSASKRVLVMEYIQGGRVDDLKYLAEHNIDRNKVALEIQRIFCQMVHLNGWFHADPHPGNLLIRPSPSASKSPYNFEVVLLDHGLYFDLDTALRINYSKLWLSLIAPSSASVNAERRRYAQLVGNIGPDLYPVFETAITGRAGLSGSWDDEEESGRKRPRSMVELTAQSEEEMEAIRNTVIHREGIIMSVFDLLRRMPRRVLMVLKLNDLTRNLDHSLATTHSAIRIFLITADYCSIAVWENEKRQCIEKMKEEGIFSWKVLTQYVASWWIYQRRHQELRLMETYLDVQAGLVKLAAWTCGLFTRGFYGAHLAASGLAYNTTVT